MSIKQKMINKLVDVLTRGRKIQIRQGLAQDFKPDTLDVGEFGLITDENKVMIGTSDGTPIQVNGGDSLFTLTPATTSDLGGVIIGENLQITHTGILSIAQGSVANVGVVKLSNSLTSTSNTEAATPASVKLVNDKIITHESTKATTSSLGHVKVDGTTITIDTDGKISSSASLTNIYQENVQTHFTSTAFGYNTNASGTESLATGYNTVASGSRSTTMGQYTQANSWTSLAMGQSNKKLSGTGLWYEATNDAFVIGNGSVDGSVLSNAFRVKFDGSVYGLSSFNATGADYAEYFEWEDGNIIKEDRVGYVVTLDINKIRKANSSDSYILGVVSVNPSVIGDSHQDDWCDKYLTDEWGRIQYHYVDVEYDDFDEEDNSVTKTRQDYVPQFNPNWDSSVEYIPREKRKEWSPVGLMGKLLVRDDGTCQVNSFAKVGSVDGELTHSDEATSMRVMERVSENIVRVFIK